MSVNKFISKICNLPVPFKKKDVPYNLGNALVKKGEMKEAIDHYRKTLKLKPDLVVAQKNLETALLRSEELE